ncbi:FAD-dependent oxidoreductase [Roseinatronobacter sp. S2]|uniref:FAD-dependent oxidoreductase n=1 Tax=Roseinatronobacter sp. S2 TaxID=3035471 RepID=UPI00240FF5A2|nr:FAD-dependent oxidoreductase [Roseinatronobacter sp. S2]WFE76532.1 FAD-dependent oxidoreductase [Roseinatronobacter sp. S2]
MNTPGRILVIGGGFSGMSAAILLSEQGHSVDLVEIDADWRSYGAGISLNGGIFRVFDRLGILDGYRECGAMIDGIEIRGPADQVLARIPTPSLMEGAPGSGGIMRPVLARLLADRVRKTAVNIRLGQTFDTLADGADGVDVTFRDGSSGRYDLVIGADGLFSATRAAVFPDAPAPRYIGQAVWRAVVTRPAHLPSVAMWMGPGLKLGITPVSDDKSYIFLTENRPENTYVPPESQLESLKTLLGNFTAPTAQAIAAELSADSQIVYRPLEQLLLPRPWYKGRVVMIGDAVHATTPHMAAGAMIGMEDAVVLAEEVTAHETVPAALDAFQSRRWERARMVVENSGRLAEIEQGHGTPDEHRQIMGQTLGALAQPI